MVLIHTSCKVNYGRNIKNILKKLFDSAIKNYKLKLLKNT